MSNAYRAVVQSGGGAAVGDATAADVLTGKTFSGAVGSGVSGTMPNQGAVSGTATPSQPYTIPAGYHNGSGTVTSGLSEIDNFINGSGLTVSDATATFTATSKPTLISLFIRQSGDHGGMVNFILQNGSYTALEMGEIGGNNPNPATCSYNNSTNVCTITTNGTNNSIGRVRTFG